MRFSPLVLLLSMLLSMVAYAHGQSTTPFSPKWLLMCEDSDGCSWWHFDGKPTTVGMWSKSGGVGNLTIEKFERTEDGEVVIRREDTGGVIPGLKVIYKGKRNGALINGIVTAVAPPYQQFTNWHAVILEDLAHTIKLRAHEPLDIPSSIRMCEKAGGCYQWEMHGNTGTVSDGQKVVANLTVEQYDHSFVIVQRDEISGDKKGLQGVYVGEVKNDSIEGMLSFTEPVNGGNWVGVDDWQAFAENDISAANESTAGPQIVPIGKLVDVVLPAKSPQPQPPPPAVWNAKKDIAAVDLNGIWQLVGTPPDRPEKVAIFQMRDHVTITHLSGDAYFPENAILGQATFTGPETLKGTFAYVDESTPVINQSHANFVLTGRDEIVITPDDLGPQRYHLLTSTPVHDVACTVSNPQDISAASALARGTLYEDEKDFATAACWYYVGAQKGNADARAHYGRLLFNGTGIPANPELGLALIQRAAMDGSNEAAKYMAAMFGSGIGFPVSHQRHDYWLARYIGSSPNFFHTQPGYYFRGWMTHTVAPCSAINPAHVAAGDALDMGRVAFEAQSFQLAHCWLRISAEEGNSKAWTYLGLMSAFGMGIKQNDENAFAYMYKAAGDHDQYAMMYLSNFYKYGIGVSPNEAQANEIFRAETDPDAQMRVQGTYLSPSQVSGVIENLVEGAFSLEMECPSERNTHQVTRGGEVVTVTDPPRSCDTPLTDSILQRIDLSAHPTLSKPEELYPETPFIDF